MDSLSSSVIAAIGTICGLVGLLVALRATRFARAVAQAQRVFEAPSLKLFIFGQSDVTDVEIALPFRLNRPVDFPLLLTLWNVGEKSASDVLMSVRCSKDLKFGGIPVSLTGPLPNCRVTQVEEENFANTLTELPLIHPNSRIKLVDRLSIRKATKVQSTLAAETKDRVPIELTWSAEYAYAMDIVLQYRDAKPISRHVKVRVHDLAGMSAREYFHNRNLGAQHRDPESKASSSFKQTLVALWRDARRASRPHQGRASKFLLLYLDVPLSQHRTFSDVPIDEVLPETISGAEGIYLGDQVFIPAIRVAPSGLRGKMPAWFAQ